MDLPIQDETSPTFSVRRRGQGKNIDVIDLTECSSRSWHGGEDKPVLPIIQAPKTKCARFNQLDLDHDVIFQNDSPTSFPGNHRFRDLVKKNFPDYLSASTDSAKQLVCSRFIRQMCSQGARFYEQVSHNHYRAVGGNNAAAIALSCYQKAALLRKNSKAGIAKTAKNQAISRPALSSQPKQESDSENRLEHTRIETLCDEPIAMKQKKATLNPICWTRDVIFVGNKIINWDFCQLQKLLPPHAWKVLHKSTIQLAGQLVHAIQSRDGVLLVQHRGSYVLIKDPTLATMKMNKCLVALLRKADQRATRATMKLLSESSRKNHPGRPASPTFQQVKLQPSSLPFSSASIRPGCPILSPFLGENGSRIAASHHIRQTEGQRHFMYQNEPRVGYSC